ncbi:MAG: DUF2062 domain-containing protein [Nanoarchaeota archaeon]|nr:DUF2062 domain-containing protein [Nanoarchaeota archaeon]
MISRIKKYFKEVLEIKKTPHEIALGFAVGTFIGILPTPGINIILALIIIFIFKHLNKIAIFGGIAIFNPVTTTPLIYYAHRIGGLIVTPLRPTDKLYPLIREFLDLSIRIIVGTLILAPIIAAISYFIVKKIVIKVQKRAS